MNDDRCVECKGEIEVEAANNLYCLRCLKSEERVPLCSETEHGAHPMCDHVREWWAADKARVRELEQERDEYREMLEDAGRVRELVDELNTFRQMLDKINDLSQRAEQAEARVKELERHAACHDSVMGATAERQAHGETVQKLYAAEAKLRAAERRAEQAETALRRWLEVHGCDEEGT